MLSRGARGAVRPLAAAFPSMHPHPSVAGGGAHRPPWARVMASSAGAAGSEMLLRDYVAKSLYQEEVGYFTGREVVGSVSAGGKGTREGLDFKEILGQREYKEVLSRLYREGGESWLTPSEIFHPWYARSVARYVLEGMKQTRADKPLVVTEIGPGNGTFALGFLDYVKEAEPQVYEGMVYEMVEISAALAQKQSQRVCSQHACARVTNRDASARVRDRDAGEEGFHVLIGIEVLDNMPHDKIVGKGGKLYEAWAVNAGDGAWREELRDLSDPNLMRALSLWGLGPGVGVEFESPVPHPRGEGVLESLRRTLGVGQDTAYVPTVATWLLEGIARRDWHVILADFDQLPDGLRGLNGPVVQSKRHGANTVHSGIFSAPLGSADIFFPTDFVRLQSLWTHLSGRQATTVKHSNFCARYADLERTQCLLGYNPMIDDYSNFSMFLSNWRS